MMLDSGSDARVFAIDGQGARVVLERGGAHAAVVHTGTSRWSIGVGPYDVRVTGTRFDVAWDPVAQKFSLDLEEGSVLVEGCGLRQRRVVAGQSVRVTCGGGSEIPPPVAPSAAAATSTQPTSTPVISTPATSTPATAAPATAKPRPTGTVEAEPAWNDLALAGRYAEALARVRADYDARCNSLSPSDLLLLADVARYAGDVARAKRAWLALRARFPADARASSAAFFLGRTAFEEGAFADAERWFDVSLRESPSGPLAREAAGRLIEACQRAGDADSARRAARRYLSEYPTGPHAKVAERVIAE
jgi:TolA-binding protein